MSETIKKINSFFRDIDKKRLNFIQSKILLTERQEKIFDMFYIKDKNIDFIADTLFVSSMTINHELKIIRKKLFNILEEDYEN
jgi:predicted DNA-binding protein YlxM (UPF0122 family)